jgi:tRNA (guanine37-N1)-methyltransferase
MARNLREALEGKLPSELLKRLRAFDLVGDIAILKLPNELRPHAEIIGEALMNVHRHVRVVLNQVSAVGGEFRTRQLEHVAGERRATTLYHENGCSFRVDLAKVYFSPRLATERMRVVKLVQPGEVVTNLFAGVGCYSIEIARHSRASRVYSIDLNPAAYELMVENIRINRVGDRVIPILGDARVVVRRQLRGAANRVLMPLPELGREFFPVAVDALGLEGGVVHFYDYGREPAPFESPAEFLKRAAEKRGLRAEILAAKRVRSYAPKCYHVVLDVLLRPEQASN